MEDEGHLSKVYLCRPILVPEAMVIFFLLVWQRRRGTPSQREVMSYF